MPQQIRAGDQFYNRLVSVLENQTKYQIKTQVYDQIKTLVWNQTGTPFRIRIKNQLWGQFINLRVENGD